MTKIIKRIEELANNQGIIFKPHSSGLLGFLYLGKYKVVIGQKGNLVEFTAVVSPDFSSRSLAELPGDLSTKLLRRNLDAYFVRWAIELGSESKEYFYCCRIVLPYSELTEEIFLGIANSLYIECKFYEEITNAYIS